MKCPNCKRTFKTIAICSWCGIYLVPEAEPTDAESVRVQRVGSRTEAAHEKQIGAVGEREEKRREFSKLGHPKLPPQPTLREIGQWLRDKAIWETLQDAGREMDAREWAATCLTAAAEDIEAVAGEGEKP